MIASELSECTLHHCREVGALAEGGLVPPGPSGDEPALENKFARDSKASGRREPADVSLV